MPSPPHSLCREFPKAIFQMKMKKETARKDSKKGNSLIHNVLTVFGILMCIVLVPILIMNCWLIARSYITGEVPQMNGNIPLIVLTNSMYPAIETGDMIICRQAEANGIQPGDVISYFDPAGNGTTIVTHRVVSVTEEEGKTAWVTKGDNNNSEDRLLVTEDLLVAEWNGTRIPKLGRVTMFMQTTTGLVLCVVLPIVLLICYDMIRRKRYEASQKSDAEALRRELEELKAQKAAAEAVNDTK